MKVIPLMVVYLFFHLTNSFFSPRQSADNNYNARLTPKAANTVHLAKAAKTTVSENRSSFKRYIQKASRYFILLLFFSVVFLFFFFFCLSAWGFWFLFV